MKNLFDIEKKIILISGANGFLGRHLFEYILKNNGTPILIDIKNENILKSKFRKKIEKRNLYFKADITNKKEVQNVLKKIEIKFKKIDGLVNLAALAMPQMKNTKLFFESFEKYNFDLWKKSLDINLNGLFLITQQTARLMRKRKYGSIVNMSSDVSVISPDHSIYKPDHRTKYKGVKFNTPLAYVVSKTGILGFTRYLATYYATSNVRVNSISPSGVYNKQPKEFVKKLASKIPLGRMAKPEEVVSGIIYLLSDASSFSTGTNLIVDGGRTII